MMSDNKKKAGRHLIELDPKRIEELAARGLNEEQIARALGVHWETLQDRKKRFSEFSDALKNGKAKGIAQITNRLFESAEKGEAWAVCFYLKTVAGFHEKQTLNNTGEIRLRVVYDEDKENESD